jgi:hypothetical protein
MNLSTAWGLAKPTFDTVDNQPKVKLIRADINPPRDFDLSEDLPRFSQGNEPPLNLTEKVNGVVMSRMQAAKKPSTDARDSSQSVQSKRKNQKRKVKRCQRWQTEDLPTTIAKDPVPEIDTKASGSENLHHQKSSDHSATQIDLSPANLLRS